MEDDISESKMQLTPDQIGILLLETRKDVSEIKSSMSEMRSSVQASMQPLIEWKSKIQGGLNLIWVCIGVLVATIGYGITQWDGMREKVIHLEDSEKPNEIKDLSDKVGTIEAQGKANSDIIANVPQSLADLKQRLTALENGQIIKSTKTR